MYTCCPQCQTVFQLKAHQISVAHGHVRCGRCGEVYSCVDALADDLDEDGDLPPCFHTDRPPTLTHSELPLDSLESDLFLSREPDPLDDDEDWPELESIEDDEEAMQVLLVREPPQYRAGWIAGSLILLLLLIAQAGWVDREQLAQSQRWRPWLQQACNYLGCRLPMRQDLGQISLISRDIRPHPSVADALIISATMQNRAAFPQPFPGVEILLSDLSGKRIAMRRFEPIEYLEEDAKINRGIAAGTLLPLVFEVVDPGQDAVAFEFSFR
jgi:predicted Zn finger-like uncharacterized protein